LSLKSIPKAKFSEGEDLPSVMKLPTSKPKEYQPQKSLPRVLSTVHGPNKK